MHPPTGWEICFWFGIDNGGVHPIQNNLSNNTARGGGQPPSKRRWCCGGTSLRLWGTEEKLLRDIYGAWPRGAVADGLLNHTASFGWMAARRRATTPTRSKNKKNDRHCAHRRELRRCHAGGDGTVAPSRGALMHRPPALASIRAFLLRYSSTATPTRLQISSLLCASRVCIAPRSGSLFAGARADQSPWRLAWRCASRALRG